MYIYVCIYIYIFKPVVSHNETPEFLNGKMDTNNACVCGYMNGVPKSIQTEKVLGSWFLLRPNTNCTE